MKHHTLSLTTHHCVSHYYKLFHWLPLLGQCSQQHLMLVSALRQNHTCGTRGACQQKPGWLLECLYRQSEVFLCKQLGCFMDPESVQNNKEHPGSPHFKCNVFPGYNIPWNFKCWQNNVEPLGCTLQVKQIHIFVSMDVHHLKYLCATVLLWAPWLRGCLPMSMLDSGLDEHVEAVEGSIVVDTEDEVCLEEFIESCQGCLCLARDGVVVNDDIEAFDVVLLFTDIQEEGLSWFQTPKEDIHTGSKMQQTMGNHGKTTKLLMTNVPQHKKRQCQNCTKSTVKHGIPSEISNTGDCLIWANHLWPFDISGSRWTSNRILDRSLSQPRGKDCQQHLGHELGHFSACRGRQKLFYFMVNGLHLYSALQLPHIHPFIHRRQCQPCKVTTMQGNNHAR